MKRTTKLRQKVLELLEKYEVKTLTELDAIFEVYKRELDTYKRKDWKQDAYICNRCSILEARLYEYSSLGTPSQIRQALSLAQESLQKLQEVKNKIPLQINKPQVLRHINIQDL